MRRERKERVYVTRPQSKRAVFSLPPLDTEIFNELFYTFIAVGLRENFSQANRMLGMSHRTIKRLYLQIEAKDPDIKYPPGIWWNTVLVHLIKQLIPILGAHGKKSYRARATMLRAALKNTGYHREVDFADMQQEFTASAKQLIAIELLASPGCELSLHDLKQRTTMPARTIRAAAKDMGLIREQEGFGADKQSYYRFARQEDLDE